MPLDESVEGGPGGVALILVQLLIAQLAHNGMIEVDRLEHALRLLLRENLTDQRREDTLNALAMLSGMQRRE